MALEFATAEAIPEPIRADFEERGGKWVPKGFIPSAVHEEMKGRHEKQVTGWKEKEARLARLGDRDPDELLTAAEERDKLKAEIEAARRGRTTEEDDKIYAERYGKAAKDAETKIEALDKRLKAEAEERAKLSGLLDQKVIDAEIESAARALAPEGFRNEVASVVEDNKLHARGVFKVEDGKLVARDSAGGLVLGADGKTPLTPKEWMASRKGDRPQDWKITGSGGGAAGNNGAAGGSGKVLTLTAFDALTAQEKINFSNAGGKIAAA